MVLLVVSRKSTGGAMPALAIMTVRECTARQLTRTQAAEAGASDTKYNQGQLSPRVLTIDAAQLSDSLVNKVLDRLLGPHVHGNDGDAPSAALGLGSYSIGLLLRRLKVGDDDVEAVLCQAAGDAGANTLRRASHNRDLSLILSARGRHRI